MDADVLSASLQDDLGPASTGSSDDLIDRQNLADALDDLQPITASTGPFQTTGLRVERFGRDGPDGVGRYWQWRWWEVNADGKKERKGRYGGIINAEATEYWQHRSSSPASTG